MTFKQQLNGEKWDELGDTFLLLVVLGLLFFSFNERFFGTRKKQSKFFWRYIKYNFITLVLGSLEKLIASCFNFTRVQAARESSPSLLLSWWFWGSDGGRCGWGWHSLPPCSAGRGTENNGRTSAVKLCRTWNREQWQNLSSKALQDVEQRTMAEPQP